MIYIEHLTKEINDKKILNDITLTFEEGKIYGIIGQNGCGKTMLLRAICGLITPSSGTIQKDHHTTFGAIIETPGFMFEHSAIFNLKYLASLNNIIGEKEITELLKKFKLYEVRHKPVKKYSLGMQQKLGIIQAIMEKPDVIILDEPFNALDESSITLVKNQLIEMKNTGVIIIIASHDKDIIDEISDTIISMCEGQIINSDKS